MGFRFRLADPLTCDVPPSIVRVGSDDRTVVAACNEKLVRMDLVSRKQTVLCSLPEPATAVSIDVNHQIVAVAAGTADVVIYDLDSGAAITSISRDGAPGSLKTVAASHIAVGPDGKMLVTTTSGSRIFVSNIHTGQWEHIMFVKYDGCDVAVSPDGKYVALFGAPKASEISGHLTMFRVYRGLQPSWTRWHESTNAISYCHFAPDSKSLTTCGAGDGARVWDTVSGKLQWHYKTDDNTKLHAAWSFGADDVLATLGDELTVTRKGNMTPMFREPIESPTPTFAVSQSGKLLVMKSDDDSLSVWKLKSSNNTPE